MSTTTRTPWLRRLGIMAAMVVPLAVTGLVVAALGQTDTALDRIPAAIVNNDEMITTTGPDGEEQIVFAGRQLVTELTGADGFDWTITNTEEAARQLAAGDVYAVLTVPEGFSESILSLQTDEPTRSDISIHTDDAHSYLTGAVAQAVGESMTTTFGRAITAQIIGGVYSSLGEVGAALSQAADGATQLGDGAQQLTTGVTQLGDGAAQLTTGANQLATGADALASGLGEYTAGVGSVAGGLQQLSDGTAQLGTLAAGTQDYTAAVSEISAGLTALAPAMAAATPELQAQFDQLVGGLALAAGQGPALAAGAAALPQVHDGIASAASGAAQLSAGSPALVSGAGQLASGARELGTGGAGLASGAQALASGGAGLVDGAQELASGLSEGAAQILATDADAAASTIEAITEPVGVEVTTDNAVTDLGQGLATLLMPVGLWLGALAVFLVLRPLGRGALASSARDGRIVGVGLGRAGLVTGAQALLLVALLHTALGLSWALLPASLAFSLVMAAAFTGFHYLLSAAFGRGGMVVSLLLLAVQIAATGAIYPVQVLSEPFRVISGFLPLTHAVQGMQSIIAGGAAGTVVSSAIALLVFGGVSVLLALAAVRRKRRATSLGLVPALA